MGQVDISEFSFGFAFLFERTNDDRANLRSFPILPNLREEANVGWDAQLPLEGRDVYFQFKLSEYMSRANAYERVNDPNLAGPYYRFTLHAHNNHQQHRLLKQLANQDKEVYYVAPEVRHVDQFRAAFRDHLVQEASRLIPLQDCDDIDPDDGDRHRILYRENHPEFVMMSKPKWGRSIFGNELSRELANPSKKWRRIDREFSGEVLSSIYSLIRDKVVPARPLFEADADDASRAGMPIGSQLAEASLLLHRYASTQLVIVAREG